MRTPRKYAGLMLLVAVPVFASSVSALNEPHRSPEPGLQQSAAPFRNQGLSAQVKPLAAGQPGLHIVQFRDVITDRAWKAMREAEAEVDSYLPDFAFVVRITPEQAAALARNPLVRGVSRVQPEWKVAPGLLKQSGKAQLRVSTFRGQEHVVTQGAQALGARAAAPAETEAGVVQLEADRSQALALAQNENVTFVDEVRPIHLMNDVARGIMRVDGAGSPWANGLTGAGQVVAVADTGLDTGDATNLHPDLLNRLQTARAIGRAGDWSDPWGHGTHVAGSVLGDGTASAGLRKGVAPDARLVMQSLGTATGGLVLPAGGLSALFAQAYSDGARIHSNSWGVPYASNGWVYDTMAQQVDQYTWNQKDFTVLFAAGNYGTSGNNTVSTPATAKNVISVGASENLRPFDSRGDNANQVAAFSSRGTTPDGRVKPDVVAPGTWILSTRSRLAPDGAFWPGSNDQHYAFMGGTSMATPLTAGSSALIRQFYMTNKGITPSASLIKATLINGAQDMGYGWMSREQGWGRVDLTSSLFPAAGRSNWFDNESSPLVTGGVRTYGFHAGEGQILKFTLVWTDYPGSPMASRELVNDLDLEVTAPNRTIFKGNCFSNNTASSSCATDHLNNVENVYVKAPVAGEYTVKVKGYNVPVGPQPFALVASGADLVNVPDTVPPTVGITAPANGALVGRTVEVQASASDNREVAKVEFYLDGALQSEDATAPYAWTWNASAVAGGPHTLLAKAYDSAGNVAESAPVTVVRDTQPPEVSITAPVDHAPVGGTVTVSAVAADNIAVARVEFYLDDGAQPAYTAAAAPYSWSWSTNRLPGGSMHKLTAKAYDSTGNVATSAPVTVVVDNQAPTVSLSGLTANALLKGTVAVGANATDNVGVAKVAFFVDGAVQSTVLTAPYTWSWETATISNGTHRVMARAYDRAGNETATAAVSVTVDNLPPAIAGITPGDGAFVRGQVAVTAAVSDNLQVASVAFYLDEAMQPELVRNAAPYTWTWNSTTAQPGSHRITVKAYDTAGNATSRTVTATVDNTAPAVSITGPAAKSALPGRTVAVTAEAADSNGVAKVEFYVDGKLKGSVLAAPFTWDWNAAGEKSGNHTLKAAAYDAAGNRTESEPVTVTVDSARPSVSIASPSANANLRGSVTVKANATDNQAVTKVEFYLDGALQSTGETAPAPYTWEWETRNASDGTHLLVAKAYDAVGNVGESQAVRVQVDNAAPAVSISTPANGAAVAGTVNVTAISTDNIRVTKVEFYVDGVPKFTDSTAPYTWSWRTTSYAAGSTHTITARAYDAAGNVTTSEPVSVTVDNVLPNLTVSVPGTGGYVRETVTVSATASDNVAVDRLEFYVDSVRKTTLTSGPFDWHWDTAGLKDGTHRLMVIAYDTAGNARTVTLSVKVHNTPPVIRLSAPSGGATVKGTVAVNASASGATRVEFYLDGELVYTAKASPWLWNWKTTTAANGGHTLRVVGYDAAGNATTVTAAVTVGN